jgi:hypothetical protein
MAALLTRIDDSGRVQSRWLEQPDVNLNTLRRRIETKLQNWLPSRPGDPFDMGEWRRMEEWLHRSLRADLPEGGHLIVLEHAAFAGLPWHVAAAPAWSASYAPGWSTLLSLHARASTGPASSLGLLTVPRFGESPKVLDAFRASTRRSRDFAAGRSLSVFEAVEADGDADAARRILHEADVAKLLCHGFVDPSTHEVALMLAHAGRLPLRDSIVAATPEGREHRLSWRDCQRLSRASQVVFSAACSTGRSHVAGLGERLGLFGAMRFAGTRAIVAPRWDCWAPLVLPVLDDALERYLIAGGTLGKALHAACSAASASLPRWLAWNLALEGDWR